MNKFALFLGVCAAAFISAVFVAAQTPQAPVKTSEPLWAFPGPLNESIPSTKRAFSAVQMFDRTMAVDWFPESHPAMPASVAGRQQQYACGFCHLPQGAGRSENAALAGLPADYIIRQVADMKSGARKPGHPSFGPANNMVITAKLASDADVRDAANYFARLKYTKHLKIVESTEAPRTTHNAFVYVFDNSGAREPLGERIVEGPDDFERFEMRDPNVTFTAYVPLGSTARGAALAKGDGAARMACASCHGADLKGGPIGPPIAGRLPSSMFRQLHGFQTGTRNGGQAVLMKPVVAGLSQRDLIDLSVYVASLEP